MDEDHLPILISLAVAIGVSIVIAFVVVPLYFQAKLTPFGFTLVFVSVGAAVSGFLAMYITNLALGIETDSSLSFLSLKQEIYRAAIYFVILAAIGFFGVSVGLTLLPL